MKNKVEKIDNVVVASEEKIDNVVLPENNNVVEIPVIPEIKFSDLKFGQVVFKGIVRSIHDDMDITINGNEMGLVFVKGLKSKLEKVKMWKCEFDGYTFETYNGTSKNDSFHNIYKNGKLFISNLGYKSIERIGTAKNWDTSLMHKQYKNAVNRELTNSGETIREEM